MRPFNIVLAGVGGQGTLLAAEVVGAAAVRDGLNVRVSEIHGMAQRGGAVVSNVRIGPTVFAAAVLEGQADVLLGFEPLETLRNLRSASEKTLVIMNSRRVPPPDIAAGRVAYPSIDEIVERVRGFTENVLVVDAWELAGKAGSHLAQNSVLLGILAGVEGFPVRVKSVTATLRELVPTRDAELNVKAFGLGLEVAGERLRA